MAVVPWIALAACAAFDPDSLRLPPQAGDGLPQLRLECDPWSFQAHFGGSGSVSSRRWTLAMSCTNGYPEAAVIEKEATDTWTLTVAHPVSSAWLEEHRAALEPFRARFSTGPFARTMMDALERNRTARLSTGATLRVCITDFERWRGWPWVTASICTVLAVNVLGLPCARHSARVAVRLDVLGRDGTRIADASGEGYGSAWAAFYYGYTPIGAATLSLDHDAAQAAAGEATIHAIADALTKLADSAAQWRHRL